MIAQTKNKPSVLTLTARISLLISALAFFALSNAYAQPMSGKPFIRHYGYKEYLAHPQNFDVIQDSSGVVYVANYQGILEYDGGKWRKISLPNNAYANDLLATPNNRIYVAGNDEAGYLDIDAKGQMHYYSLMSKMRELAPGETLDFQKVLQHGDSILFVDPFTLFILHGAKMEAVPQTTYGGVAVLGSDLFMPNLGFAFSKQMPDGELHPIDGNQYLPPSNIVIKILPTDYGKVLFVYDSEIYEFPMPLTTDGASPEVLRIKHPLGSEGSSIQDAAYLGNGMTALATANEGVLIIDRSGALVRRIEAEDGIKSNHVLGLHSGLQGAIWMATENGIARAPIMPNFLYWDESKGLKGDVSDIIRYKQEIYVSTQLGLFRLEESGFRQVEGGNLEAYKLEVFKVPGSDEEVLLLGGIWGLFYLDDEADELKQLPIEPSSITSIKQSTADPSILYIGNSDIYSVKYKEEGWQVLSSIKDIAPSIRQIEEDEKGNLWVQGLPNNLMHIRLDSIAALSKGRFSSYKHLASPSDQVGINIIKTQSGEFLFGSGEGLKYYDGDEDEREERFKPSEAFGSRYQDPFFQMDRLSLAKDGKLWVSANNGRNRWVEAVQKTTDEQGKEQFLKDSISFVTLYNTYVSSIYPDTSGMVWFGGPDGIFQYREREASQDTIQASCMISKVAINKDSVLFYGRGMPIYYEFPYDQNNLTFHFTLPSFINEQAVQFNYRLLGYEDKWSGWTNEHKKEYTNLREGKYRFEVKARDALGRETKVTIYAFEITPPFYDTWYAYILYVLLGIAVIGFLIRLNARRLLREKERLEAVVEQRTKEVVSKNEALEKQKEEISIQANNLKQANEEATRQKGEIEKQKSELEQQRDQLSVQNAEMGKQRDQLEEAYNHVTILSQIGQGITANLEIEGINQTVYESINSLMDGTGFGIGIYNPRMHRLDFPGYIEKGEKLPFHFSSLSKEDSLDALCFNKRQEILINDYDKEVGNFLDKKPKELPGELPDSIIYLPLTSQGRGVGIITVQSFKPFAYSKFQVDMLRNIAIYAGIAIENASVYQEIAKQNHKITDSINYAQNIQKAMLPSLEEVKQELDSGFVLFKPRDIVSGDFYWMAQQQGKTIIAAVDCTGHGVPGAFMSLVGDGFLKQIVKLKGVTDPGAILTEMNQMVHESLRRSGSSSRDGMDIALCTIDHQNRRMSYAGARNPLVIVNAEGKLSSIKADRLSIGEEANGKYFRFKSHELELDGQTMYYIFSDGYQDQFGGDDDRKLCRKNFYHLLESSYHLQPSEQKDFLAGFLKGWVGNRMQIDDVLVIGFKA